jgi:hypothetical protein
MHPDAKIAVVDKRLTLFVDFDFDAVEVKQADQEQDAAYYREKLNEFARFTCDVLLSGNPSAEVVRRRAYFYALAFKQPPFHSQKELAAHLGISKGAVSQQLNSFLSRNPLLAGNLRVDDRAGLNRSE